ncbi:DnaJ-class molecular chaperone with C-terminal Zn finger domain protein [Rubidibacter lacunae KORDI 51-2]|uniref:DnaJ-class molecular chaperone with C-terminal Zn finger domain protein n=1 Tax=Rubidibacter lacunae KORDI 51-2 TaxID=582515 RepID=U5DJ09_9CHRO|nr:IMS domain-containing protein [Rubidibacter lacunae]ERN40922.1 DnaJ-class molecular chaperone with C-terminal Zn finger domain protein [Rubidibacter lacunae KORDI 51-2]
MYIPLDYYRVLGVPPQASPEQIDRAYRDRSCQQLRPEYGAEAIAARQQLLEVARSVLSDPERRAGYDASFLLTPQTPTTSQELVDPTDEAVVADEPTDEANAPLADVDVVQPQLEIEEAQLAGALPILLEHGEYDCVCALVEPRLSGNPNAVVNRVDLVLALALAYRELGREHWQSGQYVQAATTEQRGYDLLVCETLFPHLQSELLGELHVLRPYRILELLGRKDRQATDTNEALDLLQAMLTDRGGIEGRAEDRSGLTTDAFLGFIQQLREHLTAAEQQEFFAEEARRPSPAAMYLTACAAIARGFADGQPELVLEAQTWLHRLDRYQDVCLERAIASLLLGHGDAAIAALTGSREAAAIATIRQHSEGAQDLLPGLCYYTEYWLRTELFHCFRDLRGQSMSLQDYFTDARVERVLETVQPVAEPQSSILVESYALGARARYGGAQSAAVTAGTARVSARVATLERPVARVAGGGYLPANPTGVSRPDGRSRRMRRAPLARPSGMPVAVTPRGSNNDDGQDAQDRPTPQLGRQRLTKQTVIRRRLLVLGAAGLASVGVISLLAMGAWHVVRQVFARGPALDGAQLQIALDRPPLPLPPPAAELPVDTGVLGSDAARMVIQTWLTSKSSALGSERDLAALNQALVDPMLSEWQARAQSFANEGAYQEFQHGIEPGSVRIVVQNSDRAQIEAVVKEAANYFRNGQRVAAQSYNDELRVRYDVVRSGGSWRIRDVTEVTVLE